MDALYFPKIMLGGMAYISLWGVVEEMRTRVHYKRKVMVGGGLSKDRTVFIVPSLRI